MLNLSVSNRYSMYSNLISQTYGAGATSSVSDSLLGMYSYMFGGANKTSGVSSATSQYLVDLKDSANSTLNSISSVRDTLKGSGKISANSDNSDAVSATYSGKEKERDDIKIDVSKIASAQVNESQSFKSNSSSLYYKNASSISISTSDGKSYSFHYSPSITETDGKALDKIAQKINKANIGVSASVETDEKTKTSKLVLKGSKTGEGNDFTVSGNLAEALGIDNVKKAASDAVYSINGEEKTSSSNKIEVDDDLTINLKSATEKTATISFGKSKLDSINAARELVNAFNGLADTAYSNSDAGAERLGNRLQSIARSYGSSLNKIGVSMNAKGYLTIDEDKMKKASENGDLDNFFKVNNKEGLSYGFTNRLENVAKKAYDDPTDYLSSSAKAEVNSSDSSYYRSVSPASYNYISAYYRYSNVALLFSAMV